MRCLRHALRWRYELVEVTDLPVVRNFALDVLGHGEAIVSRHWFWFAARQARASAYENLHERIYPHYLNNGIPLFPVRYDIRPIT